MEYLCAYDWQQEQGIALVLKHFTFQNGNDVLFACMAKERERRTQKEACGFVEGLTEWFYTKGISQCQKGAISEHLENALRKQLAEKGELITAGAVFLCVENSFFIWSKGTEVWQLNDRFGRAHGRRLSEGKEKEGGSVICGSLEYGIGILIATETLFCMLSGEQIVNSLAVKELTREEKLQKRLRELCREAERKGGKHPAAMLIVTCKKK